MQTIPMQFVRATIEALTRRDIDVVTAMRSAGLDWQLFAAERSRVTPEQTTAVVRALWEQTGDELLGVGPRRLPRGSLRLAGLTVIHTRDLRAALNRVFEFAEVTTGIGAQLRIDDGTATVAVDLAESTRIDPIVAFSAMALIHRFSAWLIGSPVLIRSLTFPFDVSHLDRGYEIIFGTAPTVSDGEISIAFDARLLDRPIVRDEAALKEILRHAPGSLFNLNERPATLESRIRRILETNPDGPWVSAEDLAGQVFLSAPHMRRRLRAEGVSVRTIQDEILRDRAIGALVHGDEPIADIAARLGYSEPSAFRRAFHRWTGSAPIDYRNGRSSSSAESTSRAGR